MQTNPTKTQECAAAAALKTKLPKIGYLQLACLLAVGAVFEMITPLPHMSNNSVERFVSLWVCGALVTILFVPMFIFAKKHECSVFEFLNKPLKWIFGLIIFLRLLYTSLALIVQLHFAITKTAMPYLSHGYFALMVGATVIYCSNKGLHASARVAPLAAIFGIVLVIVISALAWHKVELTRLYSPFEGENQLTDGFRSALATDQVFIFAVLSGYVSTKGKNSERSPTAHRSLLYFIPFVLFLSSWLNFMYNAVLGRFLPNALYPMYTIASFKNLNVLERMDGLVVVSGIIGGLLTIILTFVCIRLVVFEMLRASGQQTVSERIGKRIVGIVTVAVVTGAYFIIGREGTAFSWGWLDIFFGVTMVVVAFVLPITALIMSSRNKRKATSEA